MVVSQSCSASISPNPLNRVILIPFSPIFRPWIPKLADLTEDRSRHLGQNKSRGRIITDDIARNKNISPKSKSSRSRTKCLLSILTSCNSISRTP